MENIISNIFTFILALIGIVIWVGIMIRVFKDRFSKEKEVDAVIVDKQCYDKRVYSKSQAPYTKKEYVITFLCGKRKLHFDVSEFSYKGYKLKQYIDKTIDNFAYYGPQKVTIDEWENIKKCIMKFAVTANNSLI